MSYAQNHQVCASWHAIPDGTQSLDGSKERTFCGQPAGHFGDHQAVVYRNWKHEGISWVNKTPGKWPSWMLRTTQHALRLLLVNPELTRLETKAVRTVLEAIEETQEGVDE